LLAVLVRRPRQGLSLCERRMPCLLDSLVRWCSAAVRRTLALRVALLLLQGSPLVVMVAVSLSLLAAARPVMEATCESSLAPQLTLPALVAMCRWSLEVALARRAARC
jgi:hypothetical protein